MDDNLQEMGVGDLTVPKRMKAFGEAFYGRAAAYDLTLNAGEEPLAQALRKNILNGKSIANARRLALHSGHGFPERTARGRVIGWSVEIPSPAGEAAHAVSRT